ncbi:MAG: hypothetical protein RLZ12_403 [Bacillota bacterium]|jgi:zinc transport system permease protein
MTEVLLFGPVQRALLAGMIVGIVAPLLGVHLVVRRMSMMSEGLAHVTLPGIAIGLIVQKLLFPSFNPVYCGMLFALLAAFLLERLRHLYKHYQEIAIPLLLSGGIALGIVLISKVKNLNTIDIVSYLFGSIMGVSRSDLWLAIIAGLAVLFFFAAFYKELFAISFDEEYAVLSGVRCRLINLLFMTVVALVLASAISTVGILLVSALMTIPVATSLLHSKSFAQALYQAVIYAELAILGGFTAAYYFDLALGGTIVLSSTLLLLLVYLVKKFMLSFSTRAR